MNEKAVGLKCMRKDVAKTLTDSHLPEVLLTTQCPSI